jgi:hypothetical protein
MKKIFLFIVVASLSSFSVSSPADNFDFVGKWTGKDESGVTGGFIFDKEGYATMIKGDKVMGGKEFAIQGKKGSMKYSVNYASDPMEFDLIIEVADTDIKQTMLFAVKIIDTNHIKIAVEGDGSRPVSFTKDNSMILTRQ